MALNSRAQAIDYLRARGYTVSGWAREHGFARDTVYAVLSGRSLGLWGRSRDVAVALGLQPAPTDITLAKPIVDARAQAAREAEAESKGDQS
jgi:gp16 family phage-associated protein